MSLVMLNMAVKRGENRPPVRVWSTRRNREAFMIPPKPTRCVAERLADLERDLTALEKRIGR